MVGGVYIIEFGRIAEDDSGTEFDEASRMIVGASFFPCPLSGLSVSCLVFWAAGAVVAAVGNAAALKLADMLRRRPILARKRLDACYDAAGELGIKIDVGKHGAGRVGVELTRPDSCYRW